MVVEEPAAPLDNSIASWDLIAACLKDKDSLMFDYKFGQGEAIEVFIHKKWCVLPDNLEIDHYLIGVWGSGYEEFDIEGSEYDQMHDNWLNMNLEDSEIIAMVQLVKALKERLVV